MRSGVAYTIKVPTHKVNVTVSGKMSNGVITLELLKPLLNNFWKGIRYEKLLNVQD